MVEVQAELFFKVVGISILLFGMGIGYAWAKKG